jgi:hypothetical protein
MRSKKCLTCDQRENCSESFASWIFFIIGLVATVAVRVVTVFMNINPVYGKIAWYVGVGGFLAFFIYKFKVSQSIANTINKRGLINKIKTQEPLSKEEHDLIANILCGLKSEKERINYFFIFFVSAIALILAIYFDFMK